MSGQHYCEDQKLTLMFPKSECRCNRRLDKPIYTESQLQSRLEQVKRAERAATIEECSSLAADFTATRNGISVVPTQREIATAMRRLPHDRSALDAEVERAVKPLREVLEALGENWKECRSHASLGIEYRISSYIREPEPKPAQRTEEGEK